MTQERVLPYYHEHIVPLLTKGKTLMITAHGNSLRALVAELDKLTKEQILELNLLPEFHSSILLIMISMSWIKDTYSKICISAAINQFYQ